MRDILRISGLGMLMKYMKAAAELAANEKTRLTWTVFTRAHDIINKGRKRK